MPEYDFSASVIASCWASVEADTLEQALAYVKTLHIGYIEFMHSGCGDQWIVDDWDENTLHGIKFRTGKSEYKSVKTEPSECTDMDGSVQDLISHADRVRQLMDTECSCDDGPPWNTCVSCQLAGILNTAASDIASVLEEIDG